MFCMTNQHWCKMYFSCYQCSSKTYFVCQVEEECCLFLFLDGSAHYFDTFLKAIIMRNIKRNLLEAPSIRALNDHRKPPWTLINLVRLFLSSGLHWPIPASNWESEWPSILFKVRQEEHIQNVNMLLRFAIYISLPKFVFGPWIFYSSFFHPGPSSIKERDHQVVTN